MLRRIFVVQIRDPETGFWQDRVDVTPDYKIEGTIVQKRFLWWRWQKDYRVIPDARTVNLDARKRAIRHARDLFRSPVKDSDGVRIRVQYNHEDMLRPCCYYYEDETIWEDGKFLDC